MTKLCVLITLYLLKLHKRMYQQPFMVVLNICAPLCPGCCIDTHLNIPVGQQQVQDDIRSEQIYTVQTLLDPTQLFTQGGAAEPLPCNPNLMPD